MNSIFSPMTPEDKAEIDNLGPLSQEHLLEFLQQVVLSKKLDKLTYLSPYFKKHNLSLPPKQIEYMAIKIWLSILFTNEKYDTELVNNYHLQMFKALCFLNQQLDDKLIAFQSVEELLGRIYTTCQSPPFLIQKIMQFRVGLQKKHIEEHTPKLPQQSASININKI